MIINSLNEFGRHIQQLGGQVPTPVNCFKNANRIGSLVLQITLNYCNTYLVT